MINNKLETITNLFEEKEIENETKVLYQKSKQIKLEVVKEEKEVRFAFWHGVSDTVCQFCRVKFLEISPAFVHPFVL